MNNFQNNFRDWWLISYEIALKWISVYLTDDKSTLVQVMNWCPQAASHYLNKCWPRSMSTCGVPGPQWVNIFFYYFHIVFLIISQHNTLSWHAFPLNHYIHISISASSVTCLSSTTKKKHYLNMLSSKTNALLTHTLASFWRKQSCNVLSWVTLKSYWCAILIAHQIVMAKHGSSCVHFSGISTCGRTSRETVSHSQRQPLPTPHKIALPVYVTVTNKHL